MANDIEFPQLDTQVTETAPDTRILPRQIFTSGSLPGTTVLRIGDENILIDTPNRRISVSDGTNTRVIIGYDGTDWGLKIYDHDGNLVGNLNGTTGKLTSADGNSYWDLVNNQFIVNDGTDDRVLIGEF